MAKLSASERDEMRRAARRPAEPGPALKARPVADYLEFLTAAARLARGAQSGRINGRIWKL